MKGREMGLRIGSTISSAPPAASAGSADAWFSVHAEGDPTRSAPQRKRRGNPIRKAKNQLGGEIHDPNWQTKDQCLEEPILPQHGTSGPQGLANSSSAQRRSAGLSETGMAIKFQSPPK